MSNIEKELNDGFLVLKQIYPKLIKIYKPFKIENGKRLATKLLFDDGMTKCSQSARFLLEISIGRKLIGNETVDHIDNDPLNNEISNLQILNNIDNLIKGSLNNPKSKESIDSFIKMSIDTKPSLGSLNGKAILNEDLVTEIKKLQINYYRGQDSKLSEIYGVSRETISSIRRGLLWKHVVIALVGELADPPDLGSGAERRESSNLSLRTNAELKGIGIP